MDRLCGFDLPDDSGNRPVFAPETREQSVSKRGEGDKRALRSLGFFAERSLHTEEDIGFQSLQLASVRGKNTTAHRARRVFSRVLRCAGRLHVTPVLF